MDGDGLVECRMGIAEVGMGVMRSVIPSEARNLHL
jgi:hypothetical protein